MFEESERQTRKKRIDPLLKAAGWKIARFEEGMDLTAYNNTALEEYQTDNGPADYALVVDGKILAVIEAKKVSLGPQNVLTQAERYAEGIPKSQFNFSGSGCRSSIRPMARSSGTTTFGTAEPVPTDCKIPYPCGLG